MNSTMQQLEIHALLTVSEVSVETHSAGSKWFVV